MQINVQNYVVVQINISTQTWLGYVTFGYLLSQTCLSSVTFVHPTQPVETSGNVSTPFCTLAIRWPPRKILRRSSWGTLRRGLSARRVAKYCDVWHVKGYISETVQDTASGTINGVGEWRWGCHRGWLRVWWEGARAGTASVLLCILVSSVRGCKNFNGLSRVHKRYKQTPDDDRRRTDLQRHIPELKVAMSG